MDKFYKKECLTCEFGFNNNDYHEIYNPNYPDKLIIKCADKHYGEVMKYNFCCSSWGPSFKEFVRVSKEIKYEDFYEIELSLI